MSGWQWSCLSVAWREWREVVLLHQGWARHHARLSLIEGRETKEHGLFSVPHRWLWWHQTQICLCAQREVGHGKWKSEFLGQQHEPQEGNFRLLWKGICRWPGVHHIVWVSSQQKRWWVACQGRRKWVRKCQVSGQQQPVKGLKEHLAGMKVEMVHWTSEKEQPTIPRYFFWQDNHLQRGQVWGAIV